MEFLRSFLKRHLAGKPVVASTRMAGRLFSPASSYIYIILLLVYLVGSDIFSPYGLHQTKQPDHLLKNILYLFMFMSYEQNALIPFLPLS